MHNPVTFFSTYDLVAHEVYHKTLFIGINNPLKVVT